MHAVILWSGVLAAAGAAGLAASASLWARLGSRITMRGMLLRTLIGLSLAAILMGVAAEVWQLLLIRVIHGLLGSVGAVVVTVVTAEIVREERASALGWLQVAMVAGSATGPVLGGLVLYWTGFSLLFGIAGGAAMAIATLAFLALPNTPRQPVQVDTAQSTPDRAIRRDPRAISLAIYFLALQGAGMMTGGLLVLYVQELGAGTAAAPITGLIMGSSGVFAGLAALIAARMRGRLKSAIGIGATGMLSGLLLMAQGLFTAIGFVWLLRLGQGLTTGVLRPAAQLNLQRLVDPENRRAAYSFVARASTTGSIAGALLGGAIGAASGLPAAFAVAGGVLVVGTATSAVLMRLFDRQRN